MTPSRKIIGRPKKPPGQGQEVLISLRLDVELVRLLDDYAAQMARQEPGPEWSRSSAIRRLLWERLRAK
jgi:hypothetical protein